MVSLRIQHDGKSSYTVYLGKRQPDSTTGRGKRSLYKLIEKERFYEFRAINAHVGMPLTYQSVKTLKLESLNSGQLENDHNNRAEGL